MGWFLNHARLTRLGEGGESAASAVEQAKAVVKDQGFTSFFLYIIATYYLDD